MNKNKTLLAVLVSLALAACSGGAASPVTTVSTGETAADTAASNTSAATTVAGTTEGAGAASVAAALSANSETHATASDYVTEDAAVSIVLDGDTISADGTGVTITGSTATITAAGTYRLSGTLTDGEIVVDTADEDAVRLILAGVSLTSSTSAPINVVAAEKVLIELAAGTDNTLTDAASYQLASADTDEPNAALFSASDLTIYGDGALTINANYNDGIASKDGLIIAGGTLVITAIDDGIRGKDYIVVEAGSLTVTAGGDGLKADNDEDAAKGYIAISEGSLTVAAGGDALSAQTDVAISGGTLDLTSGGGSAYSVAGDGSAKGIKADVSVAIDGGTFTIDSADDAIHSNGTVVINGGVFMLAAADDGVHADVAVEINGGDLTVARSYEGVEGAAITINAGSVAVTASDDGINVASGVDGSSLGGPGAMGDSFATSTGGLSINGGTILVEAVGDGIDVNGAITMTGGLVIVNGPTEQMNGALDYDGGFSLTGGTLVAAGSSGMLQSPDTSSTQNSVAIAFTQTQAAGTLVTLQDSSGQVVLSFAPSKSFGALVLSSPDLVSGETYTVLLGGAAIGDTSEGLTVAGTSSGGSVYGTFAVASTVTQLGTTGGVGGGGRGPGQRP